MFAPKLLTTALLTLAAALHAACGGATGPGAEPQGPAGPRTDRLVVGTSPLGSESNEPRHLGTSSMIQLNPMYEYLLGMDARTGRLAPELAESWQLQPDGQSYRFTLRKGVPFHGGFGEFTAHDVAHTWRQIVRMDSQNPQYTLFFRRQVAEPVPVSEHMVDVKLTQLNANFLHALSQAEAGFEVISKAQFDQQGEGGYATTPPPGTGPYQFRERQQDNHITFARVEQHWRKTPEFPEFRFRWMREASTRLASLLTDEIHLTNLPNDLATQAVNRGMTVVQGQVPAARIFVNIHCCYLVDRKDPSKGYIDPATPLANPVVRRALNKAINREEMNKAFFAGKGTPMHNSHWHPTRPGWSPAWERTFQEQYGYDQASARSLLAQAGFTQDRPLETTIFAATAVSYAGAEDVPEAIAGYWRSVGVKVNLLTMDAAERQRQSLQFRFTNHFTVTGSNGDIYPAQVYTGDQCGATAGTLSIHNWETMQLVCDAFNTLDERKQDDLLRRIGNEFYNDFRTIQLFWLPTEVVANPRYVASYIFPGAINGTWTHLEGIQAAR